MDSAHLMFLAQIATMVANAAASLLIASLAILEQRVSDWTIWAWLATRRYAAAVRI
jgi:hypothetical protein